MPLAAAAMIELGSRLLDLRTLQTLGKVGSRVAISAEARARVTKGRDVVDAILKRGEVAYGINTGFGLFANVVVGPGQLKELQDNLIRSHAAGVGEPLDQRTTKMLMALRMNTLCKGHSGIRLETVEKMAAAFNADCLSVVPSQGTVGASGDLAPLSHLVIGLMGEGEMWDPSGAIRPAADVLAEHGLTPIELGAKEGLALINGTQMMTAIGADATFRAKNVALVADVACALSVEVLKGTRRAFHSCIQTVRPHPGQGLVASRLRSLLSPNSALFESHRHQGRVQDAYSLRCAPQVHGVVNDTIAFVEQVITTECNSALDNPMIFTGSDEEENSWEPLEESVAATIEGLGPRISDNLDTHKRVSDTFYRGDGGFVISGGNFHGEYPAKALDFLAIGIQELANISERRLERLVNPSLSELPAFLVQDGGLNSGFMIAHCTSAALASENKVLCHPSSVDTISTSGSKEDHVSMGGFAARKAIQVVRNVEMVIAIELLAACQALEFFRPLETTPALEAVHELIRTEVAPWDRDRYMTPDIERVVEMVRDGRVVEAAYSKSADLY